MALLVTLSSLPCRFLPCPCLTHRTFFMTSHTAQVEVFFFLPCTTVGLQSIILRPFQNPIGAIPHSGSILAGIRACLKDDLNCLAAFPLQTLQSLFSLSLSFICSFRRKRRTCRAAEQGAECSRVNTAITKQPCLSARVAYHVTAYSVCCSSAVEVGQT